MFSEVNITMATRANVFANNLRIQKIKPVMDTKLDSLATKYVNAGLLDPSKKFSMSSLVEGINDQLYNIKDTNTGIVPSTYKEEDNDGRVFQLYDHITIKPEHVPKDVVYRNPTNPNSTLTGTKTRTYTRYIYTFDSLHKGVNSKGVPTYTILKNALFAGNGFGPVPVLEGGSKKAQASPSWTIREVLMVNSKNRKNVIYIQNMADEGWLRDSPLGYFNNKQYNFFISYDRPSDGRTTIYANDVTTNPARISSTENAEIVIEFPNNSLIDDLIGSTWEVRTVWEWELVASLDV